MLENASSTNQRAILVTGGAGYGGSVLVRQLLEHGHRVICLDNLRYGGAALVDVWDHPAFTFEKADITNDDDLRRVFLQHPNLSAVVHLAAIVGDPACKLEPELARKTNLDASIRLLERSVDSGVKRFVFASTCSNYGKMSQAEEFLDENSPLAPVSLYAELKVAFETFLLTQLHRNAGISPTVLRFSTVYGISPRMRFDLTVNEFSKEIALGRVLCIFGEQFWRPYCHVRDYARAIMAVLDANEEAVAFNVFNVGDTSQNYTKKMLADEILAQAPQGRIEYVRREEDPRDYRVSFSKISDCLGFRISRAVPEGIREVMSCVRARIIDPQDQVYYNIPV